ncbi:MAG: CinA family protein [Gammaproteobacteria bacterium]|nr:CinA family protein [Gammaproteobacteria bacterium]
MELKKLAEEAGAVLKKNALVLSTAESCTGGWIAKVVTDVPGSSGWFDRGFVTYTNQAKQEMLAVKPETLLSFGAVSEQTVQEMAEGALALSNAQVSLAVSGVAGPSGGTDEKPVGMVCFAWSGSFFGLLSNTQFLDGDREQIRRQAVEHALTGLLGVIKAAKR